MLVDYVIKQEGDEYIVLDPTGSRVLGRHRTLDDARDQERAIETRATYVLEETDNQIRYRIRPPEHFRSDTFRTIQLSGVQGVSLVIGKLKPEHIPEGHDPDSMVPQALRFAKPDWDMERAKSWLASHPDAKKHSALDTVSTLPTVDLPHQKLFTTGTFNGVTTTQDDLNHLIQAYRALKGKWHPFLKLRHVEGRTFQDAPFVVGWIENLRLVGNALYGDLLRVPTKVAQLIKAGAFNGKSAEIWHNLITQDGTLYPRALKAVALLGTESPALWETLDGVTKLYEDNPKDVVMAALTPEDRDWFTSRFALELLETPANCRYVVEESRYVGKPESELDDDQFAAVWTEADGTQQRKLRIDDAEHVRAAMARLNQTHLPPNVKARAAKRIIAAAKRHGMEIAKDSAVAQAAGIKEENPAMDEQTCMEHDAKAEEEAAAKAKKKAQEFDEADRMPVQCPHCGKKVMMDPDAGKLVKMALSPFESRIAQYELERRQMAERMHGQNVALFLEEQKQAGRVIPRFEDKLALLLNHLSDEQTIAYAGKEGQNIPVGLYSLAKELVEAFPKQVDFRETAKSAVEDALTAVVGNVERLPDASDESYTHDVEARAYQQQHPGTTYRDALQAVRYSARKERHQQARTKFGK